MCEICGTQLEQPQVGGRRRYCSHSCRLAARRVQHAARQPTRVERILAKCEWRGDCLVWTGLKDKDGYGKVKFEGKTLRTHRYIYSQVVGDIPDQLYVCHSCDNPPCCNPAHLWLGTNDDNMTDRQRKGRTRSGMSGLTHCYRAGHPFTPENTYIAPDGKRTCRECRRKRHTDYMRIYQKKAG